MRHAGTRDVRQPGRAAAAPTSGRRRPREGRAARRADRARSTAPCGSAIAGVEVGRVPRRRRRRARPGGAARRRRPHRALGHARPALRRRRSAAADAAAPGRAACGFEASVPRSDRRHDRERAVTVTAYVATGYNTDRVTRDVLATLDCARRCRRATASWPAARSRAGRRASAGIGSAIIVAMFGDPRHPGARVQHLPRHAASSASVIPLGVVGGLLALFLTGYTLSFTAMIGFVALIGIEIKNSILLVDFTNQLRAAGHVGSTTRSAGPARCASCRSCSPR